MVLKSNPASRRGVRKKQTRLSFSPLPSSSPAKDKYSTAIRDRLANVRYDGGGSSQSVQDIDHGARMLLTPGPSSRIEADSTSSPLSNGTPSTPGKRGASDILEDEDEDEIVPSSKRRRTGLRSNSNDTPVRRSARLHNSSPPSSSEVFSHIEVLSPVQRPSGQLSDLASAETSDEDVLVTQPTQRRRRPVRKTYDEPIPSGFTRKARSTGTDDWLVEDNEVEYVSSEGDTRSKRKQKRTKTPRKIREEQEELEADLEDLQDSDVEKSTRKCRTRGGPVTTERDKAKEYFDVLKRRRAGEKVPRIRDSDDEEIEEAGRDIGTIGQPAYEVSDESSEQSSVDEEPEAEEAYEDDFVEDDITGRLGRPHPDIPLEFTRFASAKPRELFPHIVDWLVKNKLAPAFSRHDPVYKLAFDRIDDQVRGQAGSRLISSAWNAEFKWTILARPDISISADCGPDEDLIRSCDACNKSNRPARYDFVLSGDPYYKDSLEPIENSDDGEDDVECDEGGHELAPQTRHFYLGSHCAANAQMGHKLSHWKFHLNESILAYLEEQGVLSAEGIVARDKLNKKKREKEAEAIVDSMEEIGKVEELWKDFQNDLQDAMLGMEDYQRVGGRSKGRVGVIRSSGADGIIREWNENKYRETRRLDSDSDA